MDWKSQDNKLISTEHTIVFERRILDFVKSGWRSVVLLDVPEGGPFDNNNVFCVSDRGEILWRIEGEKRTVPDSLGVYVGILEVNDQTARISVFDCHVYTIDMNNGKIISSVFTK